MKKYVPYGVENIVRKGEIACYKQFLAISPFFTMFSIAIYLKGVEMRHCVVMS